MIVGIVGSRHRNSKKDDKILSECVFDMWLDGLNKIITGDCKEGADKFAREIAEGTPSIDLEVKIAELPPQGSDYYEFVKAYYKRNEEIAKEPLDYLIALVVEDRKGGTEHTIKMFKKHHKDWEKKLILI